MDRDELDYNDVNGRIDDDLGRDEELYYEDDYDEGWQISNAGSGLIGDQRSGYDVSDLMMNNLEKMAGWASRGTQGKIFGFIIGIGVLIAQAIRIPIMNLILGKHDQLALRDAFMRGYMSVNKDSDQVHSDRDWKSEHKNDQTKEAPGKSDPEEGKSAQEARKQKDEDNQKDIGEVENTEVNKDEMLSGAMNKNVPDDLRDEAVDILLNNDQIRKVFSMVGVEAEPEVSGGTVYLLKKSENGLMQSLYGMEKMDLLTGDARSLASALHAYGNRDLTDCALKAAVTVAAAQYLANSEAFSQGQLIGKNYTLSYVNIETPTGAERISIRGSRQGLDALDILYNGKPVATIPVDTVIGQPYDTYGRQINDLVNSERKDTLTFGHDNQNITLKRISEGVQVIYRENSEKGKDLGTFKFDDERDIVRLKDEIYKNAIPLGEPEAVAYAVAMVSNPDMKPFKKNDGSYLNPFSSVPEPSGQAHLGIIHNAEGVTLKVIVPDIALPGNPVMVTACSWQSFDTLDSDKMMLLIRAVEDARAVVEEAGIIEGYDRAIEIGEPLVDNYFGPPVIMTPGQSNEAAEVNYERNLFDGGFKEVFKIPDEVNQLFDAHDYAIDESNEIPIESQEPDINDIYQNAQPYDIIEDPERFAEIKDDIADFREEEMVNYEPGEAELDEEER